MENNLTEASTPMKLLLTEPQFKLLFLMEFKTRKSTVSVYSMLLLFPKVLRLLEVS